MKTSDAGSSDERLVPTNRKDRPTDDLIIRYWLGEVSSGESDALEELFREDPKLHRRSDELFAGIKASGYSMDTEMRAARTAHIVALVQTGGIQDETQSSVKQLSNRHAFKAVLESRDSLVGSVNKKSSIMFRITGALAVAVALVIGFWYNKSPNLSTGDDRYHAFVTKAGEQSTINLPDGSSVTINVASRVLVPVDYADGNRNMVLEGEALFRVESNPNAPFTVTSGPTVTRVLGTTFSVRRYTDDTVTSVAVRDGRVRVGSAVVSASQQLLVFDASKDDGVSANKKTHKYQLEALNDRMFDFANGILAFDNVTLSDAIPELERWYDVEIRLMHPDLKREKIDGGFKVGSQSSLVSILELTFNVQVVQKGRVINVYRRHS